ncbi:hypothetical protein BC629DRAFT_1435464 [Irpex lacteus]|nr:hypothetical protein BC629DRAFT_1435464 [Irpex lacteus]
MCTVEQSEAVLLGMRTPQMWYGNNAVSFTIRLHEVNRRAASNPNGQNFISYLLLSVAEFPTRTTQIPLYRAVYKIQTTKTVLSWIPLADVLDAFASFALSEAPRVLLVPDLQIVEWPTRDALLYKSPSLLHGPASPSHASWCQHMAHTTDPINQAWFHLLARSINALDLARMQEQGDITVTAYLQLRVFIALPLLVPTQAQPCHLGNYTTRWCSMHDESSARLVVHSTLVWSRDGAADSTPPSLTLVSSGLKLQTEDEAVQILMLASIAMRATCVAWLLLMKSSARW